MMDDISFEERRSGQHAAPLSSWRLRRVWELLSDGDPHSTKEIARRTQVLAISSVISELRTHGADIVCNRKKVDEKWVFFYTMLREPSETRDA